jgi:hypothetical protein
MAKDTPEGEVIFEFLRIGNSVKVTALHVATDTEISLVGAPSAGDYGLKLAALRKLNYVLAQKRNGA